MRPLVWKKKSILKYNIHYKYHVCNQMHELVFFPMRWLEFLKPYHHPKYVNGTKVKNQRLHASFKSSHIKIHLNIDHMEDSNISRSGNKKHCSLKKRQHLAKMSLAEPDTVYGWGESPTPPHLLVFCFLHWLWSRQLNCPAVRFPHGK